LLSQSRSHVELGEGCQLVRRGSSRVEASCRGAFTTASSNATHPHHAYPPASLLFSITPVVLARLLISATPSNFSAGHLREIFILSLVSAFDDGPDPGACARLRSSQPWKNPAVPSCPNLWTLRRDCVSRRGSNTTTDGVFFRAFLLSLRLSSSCHLLLGNLSAPPKTYRRLRLCTRVQVPSDNLAHPTPPCRTIRDKGTTTRTAVRRPSSSSMARRRRRTTAARECETWSATAKC
jgi:hypothetical protein